MMMATNRFIVYQRNKKFSAATNMSIVCYFLLNVINHSPDNVFLTFLGQLSFTIKTLASDDAFTSIQASLCIIRLSELTKF